MCMCISMHRYRCICMHARMYVYVFVQCMCMCTHVWTCLCMCICIYVYICVCVSARVCMCGSVCRAIHVCVCCMTASTRQTTPHEAMIDQVSHQPYPAEPETGTTSGPRFWNQIWSQKREPAYFRLIGTGSGSQNGNHGKDQDAGRSLDTDGQVTRLRPACACWLWFPFWGPEF